MLERNEMKKLLHVGCGPQNINSLKGFPDNNWAEIRFDIDQNVNPDVIGTLTDMSAVETESIDAIYSSHNLEHIFPHEVTTALSEFIRILKPDGFLVLTCPDLESVCAEVAKGNLDGALYISPAGPIAPLDILYGHQAAIEKGNVFMAHRCGFTWKFLNRKLHEAGFQLVYGGQFSDSFALKTIACKSIVSEEYARYLSTTYLP